MNVSVFDLFKIGIGPSSSHTVGPMRAAARFAADVLALPELNSITRIKAELFGSLGATGRGHGSDQAVLLGLEGNDPQTVDVDTAPLRTAEIRSSAKLNIGGKKQIRFNPAKDLSLFRNRSLPFHPNGMTFSAYAGTTLVLAETYYSTGGGFVVREDEIAAPRVSNRNPVPFPFRTGADLEKICRASKLNIAELMLKNEYANLAESEVFEKLDRIWQVMQGCVTIGCHTGGILPGGLGVHRRAPDLYEKLTHRDSNNTKDPLTALDWLTLWALAVNEQNAAGGRIVTAPTNGAAGIVPAVLHYIYKYLPEPKNTKVTDYLLVCGAIGSIYQQTASISGADVGCQGEVGVACSMAAAGLCHVMGGSVTQVLNAAEIGLEHNLGLTCDPVGGLVQIPCIERNAVGSVKALTAARLALSREKNQIVSLDTVIKTMMDTGRDMKPKYKETARGGLAVNIVEC